MPAKYKKFDIQLTGGPLTLYASPKILGALAEVTEDMTVYHGVRLSEVFKAVYNQGLKDGRKDVIDAFSKTTSDMNYLPPGQPKKKKKKAKK